jgi:hypothetical protein
MERLVIVSRVTQWLIDGHRVVVAVVVVKKAGQASLQLGHCNFSTVDLMYTAWRLTGSAQGCVLLSRKSCVLCFCPPRGRLVATSLGGSRGLQNLGGPFHSGLNTKSHEYPHPPPPRLH